MKTVALIPIKTNNVRLPGKNTMRFFDGTPLMHFIQRVCLSTSGIDETYVFCSDESIKDYLLSGVIFKKRPDFLDLDDCSINQVIAEFVNSVDADIYLQTHATSPFASVNSFSACLNNVLSGEFDSAFCAIRLSTFLWQDNKPLNFDPTALPRTQDLPLLYAETSGAYVFSRDNFLKYGRRVGEKPYIHEVDDIEATDIDYLNDFAMANIVYKEIILKQ